MNFSQTSFLLHVGFAGLLLVAAGCGGSDGIGGTLPVAGKVVVDTSSPATGVVTFTPDESKGNKVKAAAVGSIVKGEYTLTTQSATGSKTGAPAGWYKVTVTTVAPPGADAPPGATPAASGPMAAPRFTIPSSTPLVVEVKEGGSYDLKVTSR